MGVPAKHVSEKVRNCEYPPTGPCQQEQRRHLDKFPERERLLLHTLIVAGSLQRITNRSDSIIL